MPAPAFLYLVFSIILFCTIEFSSIGFVQLLPGDNKPGTKLLLFQRKGAHVAFIVNMPFSKHK